MVELFIYHTTQKVKALVIIKLLYIWDAHVKHIDIQHDNNKNSLFTVVKCCVWLPGRCCVVANVLFVVFSVSLCVSLCYRVFAVWFFFFLLPN